MYSIGRKQDLKVLNKEMGKYISLFSEEMRQIMYISVFYDHVLEASRQTGLPVNTILNKIRTYGIEAVELDMDQLEKPEEMYESLTNAGFRVSNICCMFDFGQKPDDRKSQELVDTAKLLHCDKVMPIPGFLEGESEEENEIVRNNMLKGMKNLCEYANAHDIRVSIEDFDDSASPIADSAGMLWFLDRIPELKVTFDTGNFMYSNEEELHAFRKLSSRIIHVHCKDRSLKGLPGEEPKISIGGAKLYPSPVGSGCIRMKEILELLKEMDYKGALTIEHFGSMNQFSYMKESAGWLSLAGKQ